MNWTDIEAKWTAMTRRVQSDHSQDYDDLVITGVSVPLDRPAT